MNKTIKFFKEISKIPRESGNEENISNYLCDFAKKRNLYYEKDAYNNVIIIKKSIENKESIILQAHMDMVCEKDENIEFDFERDSIEIIEEDGYLHANKTTLGADNGIGVAQILNILDSDLKCNIEAVFTVSEETTMIGAEKIDLSKLESKAMINLDGFEENTIVVGSSSFFDIILESNYEFKKISNKKIYKIKLSGLLGGHSGFDIDKNRGNASIILAELLNNINDIEIVNFVGGTKFNVIPSSAECIFASNENIEDVVNNSDLTIKLEVLENNEMYSLDNINSNKFIKSILSFKHGVFSKNSREEVTTSINLGVIDLKNQIIKIGMRSSKKEEETQCLEYIESYSLKNNLKFTILGSQPGFDTSETSSLVKSLKNAYENINNGNSPAIKSLHITVEAGFFREKIPNLDVAIISPKIIGAHTSKECVNIQSINECDKWLNNFLVNLY